MLSNVTHSNFYFEYNTERGSIDQLYIELGIIQMMKNVSTAFYKSLAVSRLHSKRMQLFFHMKYDEIKEIAKNSST